MAHSRQCIRCDDLLCFLPSSSDVHSKLDFILSEVSWAFIVSDTPELCMLPPSVAYAYIIWHRAEGDSANLRLPSVLNQQTELLLRG